MRIALLGDIHANLPALQAALEEARRRNLDRIYHLGDLVGYSPFPNEVIDLVRREGIPGVRGNYDENVANDARSCGCEAKDARQVELAHLSFEWTKAHTSLQSKEFLGRLPREIRFEAAGKKVHLFHASPKRINQYLRLETPDRVLVEMGEVSGADVLIFGHSHVPYFRVVRGRHFINVGSVGRPKDGDPRTCLAVVEIGKSVSVEFVRVAYDTSSLERAFPVSGLPMDFFEEILQGR